jgi:hypothetical protein
MTNPREPARRGPRRGARWSEGSEADLAEGAQPWDDDEKEPVAPKMPPDAPEADVLEQSESADLDEDDRR